MTFPTLLDRFINHPAARALGWALLHFVWQGAILAAIFHIANTLTRQSRASLRYVIGCIVMLLMPIVFVATILQNGHSPATALSAQHSIASGLFAGWISRNFVCEQRANRKGHLPVQLSARLDRLPLACWCCRTFAVHGRGMAAGPKA